MSSVLQPDVPGADIAFERYPSRTQAALNEPPFQVWTQPGPTVWTLFLRQGSDYLLRFPGFADFSVSSDGKSVACWPAPATPQETVSHLYLNQVLPLALSRQGRLVLHGSAIAVQGQCIAFLGRSGRGKSTLAAAFATTGARFLTDDGVRLEWSGEGMMVLPSHPSIRLWDDSRQAVIDGASRTMPPLSYTTKQRFLASGHLPFCEQPQPLRRLFLLGDDAPGTVGIRECTASEALMGLVSNSFLLDIAEQDMLARHFEDMVAITKLRLQFHRDYPRRYDDLPRVREAILQHAFEGSPP